MSEPYDVLDVSPDADERAVRSAYRDLLKEHHPDQGGTRERFLRIKRAYERIVDEDDLRIGRTRTVGAEEVRVARPVQRDGEVGLLARGDGIEARLLALTDRVETERLLPDHVTDGRRFVACFDVACRADDPVTWKGRRVRFVDAEGERHLPSVYRPREEDLPGEWRGDDVELAPGGRVRSLLVSRCVPEATELQRVVYDGATAIGTRRGLRYDLDADRRTVLDVDPFA